MERLKNNFLIRFVLSLPLLGGAEGRGYDEGSGTQLLPPHAATARQMVEKFHQICPPLKGRTVQTVFRIGYGGQSATRSLRRSPEEVLEFV